MSSVWLEGCWLAEASGVRVRGRPRFGWLDYVMVALDS